MSKKIKAKKVNMSQIFNEDGLVIAVTWVKILEDINIDKGQSVNVTGVSKGKGFTGTIKRWGFRMGPVTRGQSDKTRASGSIGTANFPAKVIKGKKMAGKHGNKTLTYNNRHVLEVKDSLLAINGSLPGTNNGNLFITLNDIKENK